MPASKTVFLLKPRGFCAGVVRAIDIVNIALDAYGAPIYVRKEIVHNHHVVADLSRKGRFSSMRSMRCRREPGSSSALMVLLPKFGAWRSSGACK